jgi:hypothetical protein
VAKQYFDPFVDGDLRVSADADTQLWRGIKTLVVIP